MDNITESSKSRAEGEAIWHIVWENHIIIQNEIASLAQYSQTLSLDNHLHTQMHFIACLSCCTDVYS